MTFIVALLLLLAAGVAWSEEFLAEKATREEACNAAVLKAKRSNVTISKSECFCDFVAARNTTSCTVDSRGDKHFKASPPSTSAKVSGTEFSVTDLAGDVACNAVIIEARKAGYEISKFDCDCNPAVIPGMTTCTVDSAGQKRIQPIDKKPQTAEAKQGPSVAKLLARKPVPLPTCNKNYNQSFRLDGPTRMAMVEKGKDYCGSAATWKELRFIGKIDSQWVPDSWFLGNFKSACANHDLCYDRVSVNALGKAYATVRSNPIMVSTPEGPKVTASLNSVETIILKGTRLRQMISTCNKAILKDLVAACERVPPPKGDAIPNLRPALYRAATDNCKEMARFYSNMIIENADGLFEGFLKEEAACMAPDLINKWNGFP